jgi:hypothetical protein
MKKPRLSGAFSYAPGWIRTSDFLLRRESSDCLKLAVIPANPRDWSRRLTAHYRSIRPDMGGNGSWIGRRDPLNRGVTACP